MPMPLKVSLKTISVPYMESKSSGEDGAVCCLWLCFFEQIECLGQYKFCAASNTIYVYQAVQLQYCLPFHGSGIPFLLRRITERLLLSPPIPHTCAR